MFLRVLVVFSLLLSATGLGIIGLQLMRPQGQLAPGQVARVEAPPAVEPVPQKARILASLICDACKEAVMETRTRRMHEQILCIPCFEAREKR